MAYALRGTVAEYPHLLSVPIRESAEHNQGRLAAGYFLLLEHVANQSPSFVQTAVARAISQVGGAVAPEVLGGKLYELLVTDGRLRETYAAFVGDVMGTAIPQPGFWADVGIVEHEDETEVITRSSAIIGDPSERTERLTNQKDRVADQQFEVTLAPLVNVRLPPPSPMPARTLSVRSTAAPGVARSETMVADVVVPKPML